MEQETPPYARWRYKLRQTKTLDINPQIEQKTFEMMLDEEPTVLEHVTRINAASGVAEPEILGLLTALTKHKSLLQKVRIVHCLFLATEEISFVIDLVGVANLRALWIQGIDTCAVELPNILTDSKQWGDLDSLLLKSMAISKCARHRKYRRRVWCKVWMSIALAALSQCVKSTISDRTGCSLSHKKHTNSA